LQLTNTENDVTKKCENFKNMLADGIKLENLAKTTDGLFVHPKTQVELRFVLDLSFKPFKIKIVGLVSFQII